MLIRISASVNRESAAAHLAMLRPIVIGTVTLFSPTTVDPICEDHPYGKGLGKESSFISESLTPQSVTSLRNRHAV